MADLARATLGICGRRSRRYRVLGFLQYQRRAAQSTMAYKSPAVAVPESRLQTSAPAAAAPAPPAAKQIQQQETATTSAPADFMTSNGAAIPEPKRIAPPSSKPGERFSWRRQRRIRANNAGGPKPPAQFQFNNNAQQQTSNNALSLPAVNQPANQPSSARQMPTATETVEVSGAAPTVDTEIASQQATRDRVRLNADANSPAVAKAKLPVPLAAPGQIGGYVVDPTGAVVSNARITITPPTGGTATAVTNSQGTWLIAGLPTGNYKARAEAPGFRHCYPRPELRRQPALDVPFHIEPRQRLGNGRGYIGASAASNGSYECRRPDHEPRGPPGSGEWAQLHAVGFHVDWARSPAGPSAPPARCSAPSIRETPGRMSM